MEVRNEAEGVIRKEFRRRERSGAKKTSSRSLLSIQFWFSRASDDGPVACTCPLCATDTMALALTKLPPCYSRGQNFSLAVQRVEPRGLRAAVDEAVEKVARRPLHPTRVLPNWAGSVRLVDFCLEAGTLMIEPLLRQHKGACLCTDCREDVLTYALNRVAPRFGVEVMGRRRMQPHLMEFIRHDLATAILKAARVVAANPRH